jgi:hypothetical protein
MISSIRTDSRTMVSAWSHRGAIRGVCAAGRWAKVRVYDQAAELGEVGAGVGLFPNSVRIL